MSELRTEHVLLEITHDEPRSAATWDYFTALRLSHPGERVRVLSPLNVQPTPEEWATLETIAAMTVSNGRQSWWYLAEADRNTLLALLQRKRDLREQKQYGFISRMLALPVSELGLSVRSFNILQNSGVQTIGELTRMTEEGILECRNSGESALAEIKERLADNGLSLADTEKTVEPNDREILSRPISELAFSLRVRKAAAKLDVQTIEDLTKKTAEDLFELKNFGITALNEVREKLAERGLSLRGE